MSPVVNVLKTFALRAYVELDACDATDVTVVFEEICDMIYLTVLPLKRILFEFDVSFGFETLYPKFPKIVWYFKTGFQYDVLVPSVGGTWF